MSKKSESILVFLENKPFLGRQITQIPFFNELKLIHPGKEIICIAPDDHSAYYLKELGYIDHLISYNSFKKNPLRLYKLVKKLRNISPAHIFQLRKESLRCNILAWMIGKSRRGFESKVSFLLHNKYSFNTSEYISFNYLKLLNKKEINLINESQKKEYCLIIPVAGRFEKIYHIQKYLKIADIMSRSCPVSFIIQSQFQDIKRALASYSDQYTIFCDLDIQALQSAILKAKCVISNDCGPVHFAHIYDIPRIVLFKDNGNNIGGPVDLWFHQTKSSRKIVSKTGNIDDITPDEILQKYNELELVI